MDDDLSGSGLRKNDPYKAVGESERKAVKPGFLGGEGNDLEKNTENSDSGFYRGSGSAEARSAVDDLKFAEDDAASGDRLGQSEDDLSGARQSESEAKGFYSGGAKVGSKSGGKKGRKGWLKKGGPIVGIIVTIAAVGGVSFTSLSTQIVAWKENLSMMFGQNSAIINKRSNFILRKVLDNNRSVTTDSVFGTKFKIGSKLSKKLKSQNINYVETTDANGKKVKLLVYEDPDGAVIPVVASEKDLARANTLVGTEVDIDGRKVKITDSSMTLSDARSKNKNFDIGMNKATLTFAGKIAGWFDDVASSLFKRIVGDGARNKTNIDDPDKEKVDEMLLKNSSDGADSAELSASKEIEDEDGKPTVRAAEASDDVSDGKTYGDVESGDGKLSIRDSNSPDIAGTKGKLVAKAQKVASVSSTVACGFLRSIGAISMTVGAIQTANVISYASKYLEIADKIKAGDADEVTSIALNNLGDSIKTTAYDMDGNEVKVEGSVTESPGWNASFSRQNIVDENDSSALMVNRESAMKNALHSMSLGGVFSEVAATVASFGGGIAAFRICNGVQAVTGLVDGISDIVLAFTTAGIGNFIKEIFKGALKGAVFSAIMIITTSVISAITPMVATWLLGNLTNMFLGINGGYALLSGTQNIMQSNLQMSTGRYADEENAIEVAALTKDVESQWAAYDRDTKSPFDITSEYTFLGSIVNSLIPIVNSSGGALSSVIAPMAKLAGSSALAIVDSSASAAGEVSDFAASLAGDDNCAYLKSVGVAGDFACNKYAGAYVDEINTVDPETIYNNMESYGSFDGEDSNGNPKVKADSDYAKYIVACVTSDTQPGTMNMAVEGFIQKATSIGGVVGNGLINFGSNFVPFSGFIDWIDAAEQEANFKWNSGLACTGNSGDSSLDEEVRNFSMYNLDQRVLNEMGIIESNSTVSFLEEYYKENPLDNSFEGQIARISGMTKDQVEDTLALMEYYQYIADYDPAERYAFGGSVVKDEGSLRFDDESIVAENVWMVLADRISYADVRNRSFAV